MKPAAVDSTTLATVAYDANREVLQLRFQDRSIYHYFGVPPEVHAGLLCAVSKGSYFNRVIRGRFAHVRHEPSHTEPGLLP